MISLFLKTGRKLRSVFNLISKIRLWDPETGKQIGQALSGHKKFITWLSWEPFHRYA